MKKVISFSLWGDSKLYCQGAIDNIECAKEHYPDWVCRFYTARNCPALPDLKEKNCEVIVMPHDYQTVNKDNNKTEPSNLGMMWRFLAISDKDVDRVIFRDTDSRVSAREACAVKEWEDNQLPMHRMHECDAHWNVPVMGGMWGILGGTIDNISSIMTRYCDLYINNLTDDRHMFVIDLHFIKDVIWPHLKNYCMGHGHRHPNPFRVDGPMVGSVVHEEWRNEKY